MLLHQADYGTSHCEKGKAPGPYNPSTHFTEPALSSALPPRRTLQVADPGLGPELQQAPHEEV